jgi:hypothetical protein
LFGDAGNDTFHSQNGITDTLFGGDGTDTATDRDETDLRPLGATDLEIW